MTILNNLVFTFFLLMYSADAQAESSEIENFKKAKISLIEAIRVAEKHSDGKAFNAETEDDKARPTYEIKVLKNDKVIELKIDGSNGKVLNSKLD